MIRKFLYFFSLYCMTLPASAQSGFGICDYDKMTLPSIVCNGPAFLKETIVSGNINITGNMEAHHIKASDLNVTGSVNIHDSRISGNVQVTGNLASYQTEFKKSLTVYGEKVLLNHSIVRGEVKIHSTVNKPSLKLTCGAGIAGSIVFEGLEGIVQVTGDSIVQGKVMNGTIEFLKEECESA